jgi:hypothetical protein
LLERQRLTIAPAVRRFPQRSGHLSRRCDVPRKALALGVILVAACNTPIASGVPASASETSSTEPTAGPSTVVPTGWQPVGPALGDCGVRVALVRASGELLALCQDRNLRTHVLTTRDGRIWDVRDAPDLDGHDADHVAILSSMTESSSGTLVLVGADALDDLSSGDAAAWRSTDGVSWQRAPRAASLADSDMRGVVAADGGFVAVGADGYPGGNVQLPGLRGPAVWHSVDAMSWRKTLIPDAGAPALVDGMTGIGGGWVAWGGSAPPGTGAIWTSADSITWEKAKGTKSLEWGPIAVVGTAAGPLVAVGSKWNEGLSEQQAGAWISRDGGMHWQPGDLESSGLGGLWDAIHVPSGFVATGSGAVILTSTDGSTWTAVPADPVLAAVTMRILIHLGPNLVGFGDTETDEGSTPGIWVRAANA